MEKRLKVLCDVEITDDKTSLELQGRAGRIVYSYQACGGGGGCGGGCGGGGGCRRSAGKIKQPGSR